MGKIKEVRLVLGDQLNLQHSWFEKPEEEVLYVLMECRSETDYVRHHIQKVVGFFSAMRNFRRELEQTGHRVHYLTLDDPDNQQSIVANLEWLVGKYGAQRVQYQLPDEYRLDRELKAYARDAEVEVSTVDSEHFLTDRKEIAEFFSGKKQYLMESFYRDMRRKYDILMEADGRSPVGGDWNYDDQNRNKLPQQVEIPPAKTHPKVVRDLVDLLQQEGVKTIGRIDADEFLLPVTRAECLEVLEYFATDLLPNFGKYQDALTSRDPFLFHSRLSFGLNTKMLHPLEIVRRCIEEWKNRPEEIDLAQIEGFVRQIIGWREYMRGIYWAKMPDYAEMNELEHTADLPEWYWTGETRMKCLSHSINQSLDYAYAHHIQRLMVTGNFALLLGVHPDQVDAWYLGIYADAVEWVEITNTRGMSQFADGGIVGTKPYVSSANYIKKMGDYCGDCPYNPNEKGGGAGACPFNSLYWDFYDRHREKLSGNPRIGMMYSTWDRMGAEKKEALLKQAADYKERINEL